MVLGTFGLKGFPHDFYIFNNYTLIFWILYLMMVFWKQLMNEIDSLSMKIFIIVLDYYKLVSEPWFEGFGHTLGCFRTQTEEMIIFL